MAENEELVSQLLDEQDEKDFAVAGSGIPLDVGDHTVDVVALEGKTTEKAKVVTLSIETVDDVGPTGAPIKFTCDYWIVNEAGQRRDIELGRLRKELGIMMRGADLDPTGLSGNDRLAAVQSALPLRVAFNVKQSGEFKNWKIVRVVSG